MTLPRCIRCNRPIREGELRQSRMGATRTSYWHALAEDCCGEISDRIAPDQVVGAALRAASGRRVRPALPADRLGGVLAARRRRT